MNSQFLYFLEGVHERPKPAEISDRGLDYALTGSGLDHRTAQTGPGRIDGVVVSWPTSIAIGFYPERQVWRSLAAGVWIGMWTDTPPPGPSELQRRQVIAGHDVELGDGRQWIAPKARAWSTVRGELISGAALPCRLTMNGADGWKQGAVLPAYTGLEAIASGWWDQRFANEVQEGADGGGAVAFTFADAPTQATQCLAANYRIGPVEADLLGLWTTQTVVSVLDAAIDYPALVELLVKKKIAPAA